MVVLPVPGGSGAARGRSASPDGRCSPWTLGTGHGALDARDGPSWMRDDVTTRCGRRASTASCGADVPDSWLRTLRRPRLEASCGSPRAEVGSDVVAAHDLVRDGV